jgi:transaldolase
MKIAFKTLNSIVLFAIFFSFIPKIAAQRSLPDSLSNAKMEKDTLVSQFINRVESYNVKLKQESTTLKRKIQITPISSALPDIQKNIISITKRLDNKGKKMNLRGLNTSGIMQQQIIDKLSGFQKSLEDFYGTLDGNNVTLKEIRKDHLLKLQVSDIGLNEQLKKLIRRVNNLDSVQKSSLEMSLC